jgi:uncharacterized protein (TIGR00369 family)
VSTEPRLLAEQYAAAATAVHESPTQPPRTGDADPSALQSSGLDRLRANLEGRVPPPPTWFTLGYCLTAVDHGAVTFALAPLPAHTNYGGTLHGGVLSALSDSAMACAVLSVLDAEHWCATIELKINLLRSVRAPGPPLMAHGTVRWRGRSTAMAEATLLVDDVEVAVASSTHAIRPRRFLPGGPAVS